MCALCGEDLGAPAISDIELDEATKSLCRACRLVRPPFAQAVAYGVYRGTLRAMIHAMKYDGMRPVAEGLGALLAESMLALGEGAPPGMLSSGLLVVAVPLWGGKRTQRGFNQSDLLALAALRKVHAERPEWRWENAPAVLRRQRATESQAGLSPRQRRENLRGAFFVPEPGRVAGRDVLVVDDIYTTGATAGACAKVLLKAGARSVRVATLARAQREDRISAAVPVREIPMAEDVAFWGST